MIRVVRKPALLRVKGKEKMNSENLEVLELDKKPNLTFNDNQLNGNEMADDFFDDDFDGLEGDNDESSSSNSANEKILKVDNNPITETRKENTDEHLNETAKENTSATDTNKVETKPAYNIDVASNFDVLFDSLYNDVVGANNLISDLIEKKTSLNKDEQLLEDFKNKFEKEKEDFRKFADEQKKAIENERSQASSFLEAKRNHLKSEEARFNEDTESKKNEISLLEQSLKLEQEKFEAYKNNFEEQNRIELEKIKTEREQLTRDREQFENYKKLSEDAIKNGNNDLQTRQEQFAKYKELEQKKLDLEEKNLSQSCARFKELVSQFNSGFEQLPNEQ